MHTLEKKVGIAILKWIRARRQPARETSQGATWATVAPAKLRAAQFSDFTAVAELKLRGGLNADSLQNWDRLWRHNPALGQHLIERPIGWVLEADGAIVGYLGNISLLYRFGGRTLTAVTAHGLVVDPAYRSMSVTLVSAFFRQKAVDLFVSTSAIEAVGKIALAFKSSPLPQADYDTALFWVLKPYSFAHVLMRKLELSPSLAATARIIAGSAIVAHKLINRRRPKTSSTSLTVTQIAIKEIGNEFQTFLEQKQKEKIRLLAERTPEVLRWHFEIPGDRGSACVLGCRDEETLVGYAVVRSDTKQDGLRSSIIADMLVKNDDPAVASALWSAAFDHAKRVGSDVLEVLGFPPEIRKVGEQWNPYRRQYPSCPFYYKATDPELHKTLSNGALWYASPFDGDATLIRPSYSNHSTCSPSLSKLSSPLTSADSSSFYQETTQAY